MVADFPVCDALHLLHVGLMKKMLTGWTTGSFGYGTKWSAQNAVVISKYLVDCKAPVEIHRGMRGLKDMPRWKATEYRTFLMYVGIVILKKHLRPFFYHHFLLFFCSIVILNNKYFIEILLPIAKSMVDDFLKIFKQKYGCEHFTSNLHNLSHIIDEVERFGALDNFDSYNFENKLQAIKKLIRSGKCHIAQIRNRIIELEAFNDTTKSFLEPSSGIVLLSPTSIFEISPEIITELGHSTFTVHRIAKYSTFHTKVNFEPDKWILTTDRRIIAATYFIRLERTNDIFIYGSEVTEKKNFFETPFPSSALFIYEAKRRSMIPPKSYRAQEIICKLFPLPCAGNYDDNESSSDDETNHNDSFHLVFVPVWHTLQK